VAINPPKSEHEQINVLDQFQLFKGKTLVDVAMQVLHTIAALHKKQPPQNQKSQKHVLLWT